MLADGKKLPEFRTHDALKADSAFTRDFAEAELVTMLPVDIPASR